MRSNPYQQYKEVQAQTATPERLLLMLYDGAISYCRRAKAAIEEQNVEAAHENLTKAQDIVLELMVTLNPEVEQLSANLMRMYEYINHCLIQANVTKEVKHVEEALSFLEEFKVTWEEAAEKAKAGDTLDVVQEEDQNASVAGGINDDGKRRP